MEYQLKLFACCLLQQCLQSCLEEETRSVCGCSRSVSATLNRKCRPNVQYECMYFSFKVVVVVGSFYYYHHYHQAPLSAGSTDPTSSMSVGILLLKLLLLVVFLKYHYYYYYYHHHHHLQPEVPTQRPV